jgi:hypothetical protein
MGFGSSGIETTSSWSLWKTTREFIEKARRAAVVDGGLPRSASPGRDRQVQADKPKPISREQRRTDGKHREEKEKKWKREKEIGQNQRERKKKSL